MDVPQLELDVQEWLNTPDDRAPDFEGKVVLIEVFQMLCPGCVNHAIPQAKKVHKMVDGAQLQVIGLHSVFEHHEVMGPEALKVFCSEFGVDFPVAIDLPREGRVIPATMKKYRLEGTPTTMLVDRQGRVRQTHFGQIDDLALGFLLGSLLSESYP
ncbi:peroxiredoxin family protein [Corynebacterium sp. S7]